MGRLFGTDGVRGVAGRELDARLATSLAAAAAYVLGGTRPSAGTHSPAENGSAEAPGDGRAGERGPVGGQASRAAEAADGGVPDVRPVAVVGRDPRASGEFLEAAVVAGLAGCGVDVLRLGVIPTPGVAYLTDALGADFGVMLSASHNPAPDNGIKFFARGGMKLPDHVEDQIEARMAVQANGSSGWGVPEAGFGRVRDAAGEADRYLEHLLGTIGVRDAEMAAAGPLAGWRVVVDCAHGAAAHLAPRLLRAAGANVIAIGVEPDGININAGCGSTSLDVVRAAVTEHSADAGIAYDGDADRCLAIDAAGEVVDGDQILAILALALHEKGRLAGGTVVATVMANLGFRLAMQEAGITVIETPVGDRYLIAAMLDGKFVLGGEQSGHIIMLDHSSTGDGMLTSIQLLATVAASGRTLAELAQVMTRFPQVLVNVHGVSKAQVSESAELTDAVEQAQAELGGSGRVLVRPSGTEPAVRVMVEAADQAQAQRIADCLAEVVRRAG
ncbi:MAG TPA: phosphoglucosamine mutase [Streptosporangiaceae bacterium]|nr:phosphoglucosamine mutase [Streptosporangiaceae bacterium]